MTRRSVILLSCGALALLAAALVNYLALTHTVAPAKFSQVAKGMTDAEVRALMGPPDEILSYPGKTISVYGRGLQRLQWCRMEITFSSHGEVVGTFHHH
jgi:hypothetical protein